VSFTHEVHDKVTTMILQGFLMTSADLGFEKNRLNTCNLSSYWTSGVGKVALPLFRVFTATFFLIRRRTFSRQLLKSLPTKVLQLSIHLTSFLIATRVSYLPRTHSIVSSAATGTT
jgi:hypothetical protein